LSFATIKVAKPNLDGETETGSPLIQASNAAYSAESNSRCCFTNIGPNHRCLTLRMVSVKSYIMRVSGTIPFILAVVSEEYTCLHG
jgi:hypothetical protein